MVTASRSSRTLIGGLGAETGSRHILVYTDEMFEDVAPVKSVQLEAGLLRPPTRQDLAPRIGQRRIWFEWGSHNFATDPQPHRRGTSSGAKMTRSPASGRLDLDDLRNWLEREADRVTAKAVLWHYRPDTIPLSMGMVLALRVVR
jgi:hypothetical protein